jgi:hypothetical protein
MFIHIVLHYQSTVYIQLYFKKLLVFLSPYPSGYILLYCIKTNYCEILLPVSQYNYRQRSPGGKGGDRFVLEHSELKTFNSYRNCRQNEQKIMNNLIH